MENASATLVRISANGDGCASHPNAWSANPHVVWDPLLSNSDDSRGGAHGRHLFPPSFHLRDRWQTAGVRSGLHEDVGAGMVGLHRVKARATMRNVANELSAWTYRAGNNAADGVANAALTAPISEADTRFERMDTVVTLAASQSAQRIARHAGDKAVNDRAKTFHRILSRSRRWLRVIIFQSGTVLLVSGAVLAAVPDHSAIVLEWSVCRGTPLLPDRALSPHSE